MQKKLKIIDLTKIWYFHLVFVKTFFKQKTKSDFSHTKFDL